MGVLVFLGVVLTIMVLFDLLVVAFAEESRPEFGGGHPILTA